MATISRCASAGRNLAIGPLPTSASPSGLEDHVTQPRRALALRPVVELVEERARLLGRARRRNGAHDAAGLDDVLERVEGHVVAREDLGHVGDADGIAQVRLVDAEFEHRLPVRDHRKLLRHRLAAAEFLEHAAQHRLDRREHVLLGDEAHFDIELVELAGAAVGARVLVAKARRDLEIAVETGDHDELLELLGRLRQRVELARMDARRDQEVARALRARRGQDRRLELEEALPLHARTQRIDDAPAQHDVGVQLLAPEIEKAIFQPGVLWVRLIAENRQRQVAGRAEHLDLARVDLDIAGRHIRVFRARGTPAHVSVDPDDELRAQPLRVAERRRIGIDDALRPAVMVAQIDEQNAAVIADAVTPAGKTDRLALLGEAEGAAIVRAITMHD